jgi:hypothetical protein
VDRAELAVEAAELAALHAAAAAAAVARLPPCESPPPDRVRVAELRRRTQSLMDEARRVLDVSGSSKQVTDLCTTSPGLSPAEITLEGDATWTRQGSMEQEEEMEEQGAAPWEHGGLVAVVTPEHADGSGDDDGDERLFATVAARGERAVQEDAAAGGGGGGGGGGGARDARVRAVDADELMACDELRRELTVEFDFTEVMEAEAAERRAVVEGARLQRLIRMRDAAAVAPLSAAAGVSGGRMTRDGTQTVMESAAVEALLRRLGSAGASAQSAGASAGAVAAAEADALLRGSPRGRIPQVTTAVGVKAEDRVEYTDDDGTPDYVQAALEALRSEAM